MHVAAHSPLRGIRRITHRFSKRVVLMRSTSTREARQHNPQPEQGRLRLPVGGLSNQLRRGLEVQPSEDNRCGFWNQREQPRTQWVFAKLHFDVAVRGDNQESLE